MAQQSRVGPARRDRLTGMGRSSSISRVGRVQPGLGALALVLLALVLAAVPAAAKAEAVKSEITASIAGIIDSRATVVYF